MESLFLGRLLGILSLVDNGFAAMLAELLQLFLDLVIALFIVRADVISRFTLRAGPGTELTFSSCHKYCCYNFFGFAVAMIAKITAKST